MPRPMTVAEIDEVLAVARAYCEALAEYRQRQASGTLGPQADQEMRQQINALDLRLQRLQSNNEIERCRAQEKKASVIPFLPCMEQRKVVR